MYTNDTSLFFKTSVKYVLKKFPKAQPPRQLKYILQEISAANNISI